MSQNSLYLTRPSGWRYTSTTFCISSRDKCAWVPQQRLRPQINCRKTKQNNLPWPSTIATLSNQDHGGNENVSKECIQTTAVNHSKESSWIYALLNFIASKLQSRSHWQRCSNFLIYEFWGAVSEFNKRTDKSFFDVRVRTDADEYDCKRHWKCHWCLTKVLFRFTTNVPTCSVCQIYENFPTFELFRQPWIKSTQEPYLLVYKETGKLTLSYVFNTDMR